MKTRIILSLVAAFLLQFTSVSADNYTDGVIKLMENEAISIVNTKMFDQATQAPNVNADYVKNQMKADMVEWVAEHCRKTMSEKDFNDMVAFYMDPEVLAAQKKIVSAAASSQGQEFAQTLMPQMMTLMQGGTPEKLQMPECDPELKKALLRWIDVSGSVDGVKASMGCIKNMVADMVPANVPEEQKQQMTKMMDGLFSYMGDNAKEILMMSLVGKVDLKDVQVFSAMENKSFFPAYKKLNASMASDVSTLMAKLMAGMKKQ